MAKGTKTGGGSRAGKPNKGTQELRDMILMALDRAGGVKYLEAQARDTPASFLTLIGKVLPQNINANVSVDLASEVEAAKERLRARGEAV
jgi:hypothetical protein